MRCFLCGRLATDRHHLINGLAYRSKADEYGLVVWLCRSCHNEVHFGKRSRELSDYLRKVGQRMFEEKYPNKSFLKTFGINFLEDEDRGEDSIDLKEKMPWEL